jgi:hypothetical protein
MSIVMNRRYKKELDFASLKIISNFSAYSLYVLNNLCKLLGVEANSVRSSAQAKALTKNLPVKQQPNWLPFVQ